MNIQRLAVGQLSDYDLRQPGRSLAEADVSLSIEQAYELQFQVAQLRLLRGEQVAGYKIGCISHIMQSQLGLEHPVFGHVWQSELHTSSSVLNVADFDNLSIEGEFAVRLVDDVPSAAWLKQNIDVLEAAFIVIELHNNVFHSSSQKRAVELIANNAIHAGVVLPIEETSLQCINFIPDATLRVLRNDNLLGEGAWSSLEGGPLGGLVHLVEHLGKYGRQLLRGQIVLTGSPLPLWPLSAGDTIEVRCDLLGKLATVSVEDLRAKP